MSSIANAYWGQRRICGIEARGRTCTIRVGEQLWGVERHVFKLLATPVGCVVILVEGDFSNVYIPIALLLLLRCLTL